MPVDIRRRLTAENLMGAYVARPAYQRNDYVGWIIQAKLPTTRERRMRQMLAELKKGGVYMNMRHGPSARH